MKNHSPTVRVCSLYTEKILPVLFLLNHNFMFLISCIFLGIYNFKYVLTFIFLLEDSFGEMISWCVRYTWPRLNPMALVGS